MTCTRADDALDQLLDLLADGFLGLAAALLGHLAGEAVVAAAGQGLAALVDDGDAVGLEVGHGGGDQVLHRAHLVGRRLAAGEADGHRGRRRLGLVLEQLPARQHQRDAGEGDAVQRTDGARQLAFQGALLVQVLDEIGLTQGAGVVEQLVAERPRGHQALARHQQAGGGHLVAVDHDGRAVTLDLVLDPGLVQRLGDRGGFLEVEVRVEQRLGLVADVEDQGGQGHSQQAFFRQQVLQLFAGEQELQCQGEEAEEKGGLAIYLAHKGLDKNLTGKMISLMSQFGSIFPYMILPCDLEVKPLSEWMEEYEEKYKVGGTDSNSHVMAFGSAGREAWDLKDRFSRYYFVDADLTDDEASLTADAEKSYYIDQTDDSMNYKDMNSLYKACKNVLLEDGSSTEADFEYRMRNSSGNAEQDMLLAAKSIAENIKYQ